MASLTLLLLLLLLFDVSCLNVPCISTGFSNSNRGDVKRFASVSCELEKGNVTLTSLAFMLLNVHGGGMTY